MKNTSSWRGDPRIADLLQNRTLFASPQPAGRKITAGFTYIQRISKSASYDVWFPDAIKRKLEARLAAGDKIGSEQFPAQWAAVREFELLHESGNHKIYDLEPDNLQRTMLDLTRSMRAGGYRILVATLGSYQETSSGDELEILDQNLQERIAQMIHMLYLDEASDQINAAHDKQLAGQCWDYREALPHIGMVLGAQDLFHRLSDDQDDQPKRRDGKGGKSGGTDALSPTRRRHRQAKRFFDILGSLPQDHIVHDTAVGLQLPELIGENQWNYIAASDETLDSFNRVLGHLFDKFNGISLSRMHEREDATSEVKATTLHLRGYGDRLNENSDRLYRNLSLSLN